MEISVLKSDGGFYSNNKKTTMKKMEFKTLKDRMRYIINFLSTKATERTSKDNPSHIKGAKFMFLKDNGHDFDVVNYTIPGSKEEIDVLLNIVFP